MKLQHQRGTKRREPLTVAKVRRALADYIQSEGCSCCEDIDGHQEALNVLGKLLHVKKYSDGSGYDFSRYRTKAVS